MKSLLTLAAMGFLTASSLTANAQFTVDGMASAAEIGTGVGKYQLATTYTGNHLDADRGLKALYVGYTTTTLNIMVVGSAESNTAGAYRAIVVYLNTPGLPGRLGGTAGTALGGSDNASPMFHKPKLDMETDYGFRVSVGPNAGDVYFSRVSYVTGSTVTPGNDTYLGASTKTGTALTADAALDLGGSQFAYMNTASLTANTTNSGFEIQIPLSKLGTPALTTGSTINLFTAFTEGGGIFLSEVIPQIPDRTAPLGTDPDFTAIPLNQYTTFVLGTGALATRNATAAAFDFSVFPNPTKSNSTIAYRVPTGQQAVSLAVYNTMGQRVRSLASEKQAGRQEFALGTLPAGSYLVKLQIGDQVTSKMVVME